ncbi:MAG: histidine phosphatase family protein [Anaerolineae bacterium]
MSLIYLMRHGQSTVNVEHRLTCRKLEGDLTALGREQAQKAGEWLADAGINRILHSPFHRAEQTAQIVADRLSLPMTLADGLREMDCGGLEWRTDEDGWDEWLTIYERWQQADWKATFPGGESYRQAYDRFTQVLRSVDTAETTLLVTHGGITITVVPYLCVNASALQRERVLDNTGFVILEPYDDHRFICRAWNQTEHL